MAVLTEALARGVRPDLRQTIDVGAAPERIFEHLCEIEKWPVWFSLLRSCHVLSKSKSLRLGSEVVVRSWIPGEPEQLLEVDQMVTNHHLSLVGVYSTRRRLAFRIERKPSLSRITAQVGYPSYGGLVGAWYDKLTARRRIESALNESLVHLKGLVEFDRSADRQLADF